MQDNPSQPLASSQGEQRQPSSRAGLAILVLLALVYAAVAFDVFGLAQQQQ